MEDFNSKYTGKQVEDLLDQVASGNAGGGGGGITEVYVADFTIESLRAGIYDGTNVDCNLQALVAAMNANKVILVREDESLAYNGAYVLNGFAEDLLYFSIVDSSGNILWCDGTDYISLQFIDAQSLHERSWGSKQDTLVSGENIKTINGTSIIGSGDIEISSGEDIRYFTEFTVEQIVQEATLGGALKTDTAELSTAFENNKLICIPYQDSSNGFIIASYEVTLDGNSYLSFIYGTTYYRMQITNLFLNISIHPLITQTVFVDSGIIDIYDNTTYVVTVPVTLLKIFIISNLSVGSLIRFTVGDDCSFNFYGAPNIMWANGIIPTIESGVTYELSLIRTKIVNSTYTMAILTPFKPVE